MCSGQRGEDERERGREAAVAYVYVHDIRCAPHIERLIEGAGFVEHALQRPRVAERGRMPYTHTHSVGTRERGRERERASERERERCTRASEV